METYKITHSKQLMAKLLKADLFDGFLVREVVLHTAFKSILDGRRNMDFYDSDAREDLSPYLSWGELRPYVYHLITGTKLPSYFKIILSTSETKTASISAEVDTFFINITFKENELSITTGVAYKGFTLDKTPEKIWDEKIKNFLLKYEFI